MKAKSKKMGRMKSYAIGGALALGGLLVGGCRASYHPMSKEAEINYNARLESSYFNRTIDDVIKAPESTEEMTKERMAYERVDFNDYKTELGADGVKTADSIKRLNALARGAYSGLVSEVRIKCENLNGNPKFFDKMSEEQKRRYAENNLALRRYFFETGNLDYNSVQQLRRDASNYDDKGLGSTINMINEFNGNAEKFENGLVTSVALKLSEGQFDHEMIQDIMNAEKLRKLRTGVSYDNVGENVFARLGLEKPLETSLRKMAKEFNGDVWFKSGNWCALDDIVRKYRYKLAFEINDASMKGQVSPSEHLAAALYLDKRIAEKLAKEVKSSGLRELRETGLGIMPFYSIYPVIDIGTYLSAPDTVAGSLGKAAKLTEGSSSPERVKAIIERAYAINDGATNGNHFVGKKPVREFVGWAVKAGVDCAGAALGINALLNAEKGGGHGRGTPATANPPGPHDW